MRVGVYVDGYNLYYGGRAHCGRGTPGWRWLDVRALVTPFAAWSGARIEQVVYCTARVDQIDTPNAAVDQAIYLEALLHSGAVSLIEEGRYDSWGKEAPLVMAPVRAKAPALYASDGTETWDQRLPLRRTADGSILASVRKREEKGSDVNVASHLLRDVYTGSVDAAIVVSNDSDLALPLRMARSMVPVGTINPQKNYLAGALRGSPAEGAGRHWWKQLDSSYFQRSQLPDPVGKFRCPPGW